MSIFSKYKQKISIFLLITIIFTLIPIDVFGSENKDLTKNKVSSEDIFIYEEGNESILTGIKKDVDLLKIPNQVKIIKTSAFKSRNIKKVILNEGLEVIESEAFSNNKIKELIILPSTLKRVEDRAFADNLIQEVDFSKTQDLNLGESVFQDNKISGKIDLSQLNVIPKRSFFGNEISDIIFSDELELLEDEAFANNRLKEVKVPSKGITLGKDVFAGNGRYVSLYGDNIFSEKSNIHQYGHIVNPINIKVSFLEKKHTGEEVEIKSSEYIKFDPYDNNNFFSLNEESFYEPDFVANYSLDRSIHFNRLISFIPDKNNYELKVYYKKDPKPTILINKEAVKNLLKDKKEGSNISKEDILSLVTATDYLGRDISKDIKVSPDSINNAEAKEYKIIYSVADDKGRNSDHTITLPIAIDPFKIKIANTEWQLEDFLYDGNRVYDLSDLGKEKAKFTKGLAVPHLNPYTMETITHIDFGYDAIDEVGSVPPQQKVDPVGKYGRYDRNPFIETTYRSRLRKHIQFGELVFGDIESIIEIGNASFKNIPIHGYFNGNPIKEAIIPLPKLEKIGDEAFRFFAKKKSDLPIGRVARVMYIDDENAPNLKYLGDMSFQTEINKDLKLDVMHYFGTSLNIENKHDSLVYLGSFVLNNKYAPGSVYVLPVMKNIEYIGTSPFYNNNPGRFQRLDLTKSTKLKYIDDGMVLPETGDLTVELAEEYLELEYIGTNAFGYGSVLGSLPKMPKLKHIGPGAFLKSSNLKGSLPELPNLEYIGSNAFKETNINGPLPELPSLEYVGDYAFYEVKTLTGPFPKMPSLRYIGIWAFGRTQLSGELSDMNNLEHVGENAFVGSGLSGELPNMPNLKKIEAYAFSTPKITGLPSALPNLKYVDYSAFLNSGVSGSLPEMPSLEYIGGKAFMGTDISGRLPDMPKLRHIDKAAFFGLSIDGPIPDMPNLEYIGAGAFYSTKINDLPKEFPNLKVLAEESIYVESVSKRMGAFAGLDLSNASIPKMPKITRIEYGAFENTEIGGALYEMPNLKHVGENSFFGTRLLKAPLYINNDIELFRDSFAKSRYTDSQIPLLTYDGKDAPNVPVSDYHILNPSRISFVGKTLNGDIVVDKKSVVATKDGDNLVVAIPNIPGYNSPEKITVSQNDLVDGVYTYIYKSYKDIIDENGGNKYQFRFDPITPEGFYEDSEIVNGYLYLSTANEDTLSKGKISLQYDSSVYKDPFVQTIKGVNNIVYKDGLIEIFMDENLSQGTEVGIPVSFKLQGGGLEKLNDIDAVLYDEYEGKAYDTIAYGTNYVEPIYKSTFDNKNKKVEYKNILVKTLEQNYTTDINLYPTLQNLSRDFESIKVSYDKFRYSNKKMPFPVPVNDEHGNYVSSGNYLVYELKNVSGNIKLPALNIKLDNPLATKDAIIIKSKVEATFRNTDGKLKTIVLEDQNELNIFPEEKSGEILSKDMLKPHYNGRHSYFYDNVEERSGEFRWDLTYNITYDIKELTLTDKDLDERMFYSGINPNGRRVLATAYDENNKVLFSENIVETTNFNDDIKFKIDKIDLKYYNLKYGEDSLKPFVLTKLKDPSKSHYTQGNINNINRFMNNLETLAISNRDNSTLKGKDFAFTNIVPDNNSLKTNVEIISGPANLSYGKSAISRFSVSSKEFFDKSLDGFNYTILVEPGHRVEDVAIKNDLIADYKITSDKNGFTKIDFKFANSKFKLNNKDSKINIIDIKTTPENRDAKKLKVHGLLHEDEYGIYEVFNKGKEVVSEIDTSQYSYDSDVAGIINGEFFSIQKLITKNDYVGKEIVTKPGEKFGYRFEISNATNTIRENFELIDVLPFKEDFNNSSYRNKLDLSKNIELPEGFSVEYLNSDQDVIIAKRNIIKELSDISWSNTPAENTKAIRITADKIDRDVLYQINVPMITKSDLGIAYNKTINTNQFAYTHKTLGYEQALSNPVYQQAEVDVPTRDIALTKVSHVMGEEDGVIEGVKFTLKDKRGKLITFESTNANGELVFKNIPVGEYVVEETDVPAGYKSKAPLITVSTEDMLGVEDRLDLGKVVNNRIDEFDYLFKNVELISDLENINYTDIKNIYSREIKGSAFTIINQKNNSELNIDISDKKGEIITLTPGTYKISQKEPAKDNGLTYKLNDIEYMFEIDKFGKIYVSEDLGINLNNKVAQEANIVYFPNTVDYKTSTINIIKENESGEKLPGAEFTLFDINTGDTFIGETGLNGEYSFNDIKPGLYSLRETSAPKGYIGSNNVEIISVPVNISEDFRFTFVNKKLIVNIHKYKILANNLESEDIAKDIASKQESYTDGNIVIKELESGLFQVREVWENNVVDVDGAIFQTDKNGSILNANEELSITPDSILNISNNTKIQGHYEPSNVQEYINDYITREDFSGVIDIDIIVKPLKGSIYVSKYLVDKNGEIGNKEVVNGSGYTLYADKGDGYKEIDNKVIDNSNYLLFKDLNPLYKYKVVETSVPEGQESSTPKEYEVVLRDEKSYVETVIFRNYIEREAGSVYLNKIDGRTEEALEGVEFELIDKHGVGVKYTTDSKGYIAFEELRHELAPYTIKETKAAPGYRISSQTIVVEEGDILNEETFTVKNYKYNETPKTGTSGKLPFFLISMPLIILAYVFNKKKY